MACLLPENCKTTQVSHATEPNKWPFRYHISRFFWQSLRWLKRLWVGCEALAWGHPGLFNLCLSIFCIPPEWAWTAALLRVDLGHPSTSGETSNTDCPLECEIVSSGFEYFLSIVDWNILVWSHRFKTNRKGKEGNWFAVGQWQFTKKRGCEHFVTSGLDALYCWLQFTKGTI